MQRLSVRSQCGASIQGPSVLHSWCLAEENPLGEAASWDQIGVSGPLPSEVAPGLSGSIDRVCHPCQEAGPPKIGNRLPPEMSLRVGLLAWALAQAEPKIGQCPPVVLGLVKAQQ